MYVFVQHASVERLPTEYTNTTKFSLGGRNREHLVLSSYLSTSNGSLPGQDRRGRASCSIVGNAATIIGTFRSGHMEASDDDSSTTSGSLSCARGPARAVRPFTHLQPCTSLG